MGRVDGKVALVTGAARGQGRSHALHLAREGANVIAVDICEDIPSIAPLGTAEELDETRRQVEAVGRGRIVTATADVRDPAAIEAAIELGIAEFGKLDTVVANAAVCTVQRWDETTLEVWADTLDVNLTGTWNTCRLSAPHLIAAGGGSIIIISSVAGIKAQPFLVPYVATKHAVVGLCQSLALELAQHHVRVNTIHPTAVDTPMVENLGDLQDIMGSAPYAQRIFMNLLPTAGGGEAAITDQMEPSDVSNAVLYLASDESRYVTGHKLAVDLGWLLS
jgi:SDR family mycofactocin-dependent oxidoreductase